MRLRAPILIALLVLLTASAGPARAVGDPGVAALQVALRAKGTYHGTIDGIHGTSTAAAVTRFQRRAGLAADGIAGPRTRDALGKRGRPGYGSRALAHGAVGWDVASLQFLVAWHGFPSGPIDGLFGEGTDGALRRFQSWAGLTTDGVAGRATYRALRRPLPRSPVEISWPVAPVLTSPFGPRGARFHPGVDIAADQGTPVAAARAGVVVYADWAGTYGRLVVVAHGRAGVQTYYAHLSRISVAVGERLARGERLGRVGSSGRSTGPHLHFEIRVRDAVVNPLPALGY